MYGMYLLGLCVCDYEVCVCVCACVRVGVRVNFLGQITSNNKSSQLSFIRTSPREAENDFLNLAEPLNCLITRAVHGP